MTLKNLSILLLTGGGALTLTACIPPAAEAPPAPSPVPAPTPSAPVQPPAPAISAVSFPALPEGWEEQARTMGDWVYLQSGGSTGAYFVGTDGQRQAGIACAQEAGRILIVRYSPDLPPVPEVDIRTETARRSANLERAPDGASVVWALDASDRFLDAIAFSRGHFAIGVSGADPLYPPAWPEITRVIEDCR